MSSRAVLSGSFVLSGRKRDIIGGLDRTTRAKISYHILEMMLFQANDCTSFSVNMPMWITGWSLFPNFCFYARFLKQKSQGEFRTQKEACWVINNMVNGGSAEQCAYLLNQRVIPALSNLLTAPEAKVITMVLEIIKRLFEVSFFLAGTTTKV